MVLSRAPEGQWLARYHRSVGDRARNDLVLGPNDESIHRWGQLQIMHRCRMHLCDPSLGSHSS